MKIARFIFIVFIVFGLVGLGMFKKETTKEGTPTRPIVERRY
jgi:hypothetical protein